MKTLSEWFEEMERLDKEATKDWDCDAFVRAARTELPRAVKIIKTILDRFIDFELEAAVQEEIETIINGE